MLMFFTMCVFQNGPSPINFECGRISKSFVSLKGNFVSLLLLRLIGDAYGKKKFRILDTSYMFIRVRKGVVFLFKLGSLFMEVTDKAENRISANIRDFLEQKSHPYLES